MTSDSLPSTSSTFSGQSSQSSCAGSANSQQRDRADRRQQVGAADQAPLERALQPPAREREQQVEHDDEEDRAEDLAEREHQREVGEAAGAPRSQAKPVAAISIPTRLSGRRPHAYRPTPMKPHPTISAPRAPSAGVPDRVAGEDQGENGEPEQDPRARERPQGAAQTPSYGAHRSASSADPDSSDLGMKPRTPSRPARIPRSSTSRLEVSTIARRAAVLRQPGGHLEAVDVRQLHVEQDHVRMKPVDGLEGAHAVLRLADHLEALALEQHRGRWPGSSGDRRR